MVVITALNIVVVILAYLARFKKHQHLLLWAFIILAVVLGVRYGYGNDYMSYKYIFVHEESDEGAEIESGWLFLMTLFRPIGFYWFVFSLCLIEHLMLWDIIRRHVPPQWYWLSLFIYVFNFDYMLVGLSMMRQFLVMLMGFYALEMAVKKKAFPFLLIITFGFLIHKLTILYLPLYGLPYLTKIFSTKWSFVVFFAFAAIVFKSMLHVIEIFIPLISENAGDYAIKYFTDRTLNDDNTLGRRYIIHYAFYIFFLIRNYRELDAYGKCAAFEVLLGCLILPFFSLFVLAVRLSWMFTIVEIVSFPLLISKERKHIIKYGASFSLILFIVLFEYNLFYSETYGKYYLIFRTIFSAPDLI